MNSPGRELFAEIALREIPKLLTLQDRNPHSPTYGCFDRNYWHYKTADFPCGMSQEFVWPLALATETDFPSNPYRANEAIRQYVRAGIVFAARSGHRDGSCDDYFPNERALGAAAFSLIACAEACQLIGIKSDEALEFLQRRARWLSHRDETGRLSNHQALIALGLDVVGRLCKIDIFAAPRDERLSKLLASQTTEGWFPEYDGFDPGYDTLTLSCLARLHQTKSSRELDNAIRTSVSLLSNFVHPDGSFGGEYGSRNTYNFFPHGFELVGAWLPDALAINDRFLVGLRAGRGACYADDRIVGHHLWNYLLAARDFVERDAEACSGGPARAYRVELAQAGIVIDRRSGFETYVAPTKGGVLKLFRNDRLALSDTGISLRMRDGRIAVTHLIDNYERDLQPDRVSVRGQMGWAKQKQLTPLKLALLRVINLTIGRIAPNLVRQFLQRLLIVGKRPAPFRFERTIEWTGSGWNIVDQVEADSWREVEAAGVGPDQTSIAVAMSRTFQPGQLQPWLDLTGRVRTLRDGEPLVVQRSV
ncbi:MAG: hypothetical protein ABR514_00225 [Chthoniobacterales bacterium]